MSNEYNLYNLEPSFRNYLLAEKVSAITLKNYLSDLRHFLGWLTSHKQTFLNSENSLFSSIDIKNYLSYLRSTQVPEATLNRRLSTLRKFCSFCFSSKIITENYL